MKTLLTIGRSSRCDIVLNHTQISAEHASVRLLNAQKGLFEVEDLGSTNGVQKNGVRTQKDKFSCEDRIDIAGVLLPPSLFLPYFYDMEKEDAATLPPAAVHAAPLQANTEPAIRQRLPNLIPFLAGITTALVCMGLFYAASTALPVLHLDGPSFRLLAATSGYALLFAIFASTTMALIESGRNHLTRKRQGLATLALWRSMVETSALRQTTHTTIQQGWNGYRKFTVIRQHQETPEVYSLLLKPHDGKPVPPFKAGQFIKLRLPNPKPGEPLIRCYSLADCYRTSGVYQILVQRSPVRQDAQGNLYGLSAKYLTENVQAGSILDIAAPQGHFTLAAAQGTPLVMVGEGIEVAPLLCLLNALVSEDHHPESWFFYTTPHPQTQLISEKLQALVRQAPHIKLQLCHANADANSPKGKGYDHHGAANIALLKRLLPSNNFHFFLSLPPAALVTLLQGLREWGVPASHLHFEVFSPIAVKPLGKLLHKLGKTQRTIHFARTDQRCTWQQADGSLLDIAKAHGITIASGCRTGRCGACLVAIRSGQVGYLTPPGQTPEEGACLSCIAYPKSNISLDA